jgi:hypothetical protein
VERELPNAAERCPILPRVVLLPTTSTLIAEVEMAEEPVWGLRRNALGIHASSRKGDGDPGRHGDIL